MPKDKNNPNKKIKKNDDDELYELNSVEEQEKVVKFIDELIKKNIRTEEQINKHKFTNYNNLLSINSEWLDAFLILGYDMKGNEIVLCNTRSAKDYHSILSLLKKAFLNLVVKNDAE